LPLLKSHCSYGPISHTTIWMESPPTGYYPCMAARLHRCHPPTSVNSILRFHVSIVTTSRIDSQGRHAFRQAFRNSGLKK
jgi:hypothetical protein